MNYAYETQKIIESITDDLSVKKSLFVEEIEVDWTTKKVTNTEHISNENDDNDFFKLMITKLVPKVRVKFR